MQSIQSFSRRQAHVCVRISQVVLIGFLPLVSFAQQVQPQSEQQVQTLPEQQAAPPTGPPAESQPEQQPSSQTGQQVSTQAEQQVPAQAGPQVTPPIAQCGFSSPRRCFMEMAKDQKGIVTSPLGLRKKDLAWLVPAAAVTGAALAFDQSALNHVSTDPVRVSDFRRASNLTGIYIPVAVAGTALLGGTMRHDEHLRETGALAMTAMADTQLLTSFLKFATNRVRPQTSGPNAESGEFWPGGQHFSADSFPSGHTANAFAVAHVIADEYPGWKVKLAVYGLAAATGFERIQGREHFPSDVLVGGAIGYFVGGYIFNHHSTRSKTHIAFAPMIGHGGAGVSLQISPGGNK
jgi:membrane-associated phospholipid phosphatase